MHDIIYNWKIIDFLQIYRKKKIDLLSNDLYKNWGVFELKEKEVRIS